MKSAYHKLPDEHALAALPPDPDDGIIRLVEILQETYADDFGSYTPIDDRAIRAYIEEYVSIFPECLPSHVSLPKQGEGLNKFREHILEFQRGIRAREHAIRIFSAKKPEWTVSLTDSYRIQLRELVQKVRSVIDNAELPLERKQDIIDKLNAFSAEVEKERSKIDRLGALWLSTTRYVGEGAKNLEPAVRLIERVRKVFGAAQDDNEEQLLLQQEQRKQLPAPKPSSEDTAI